MLTGLHLGQFNCLRRPLKKLIIALTTAARQLPPPPHHHHHQKKHINTSDKYNFMQEVKHTMLQHHEFIFIDIFCTNGCLKTTNTLNLQRLLRRSLAEV